MPHYIVVSGRCVDALLRGQRFRSESVRLIELLADEVWLGGFWSAIYGLTGLGCVYTEDKRVILD